MKTLISELLHVQLLFSDDRLCLRKVSASVSVFSVRSVKENDDVQLTFTFPFSAGKSIKTILMSF